jgi:hypothetical protein
MTDSAAPKPDWILTTIEDIEARIARGEWPRVRAIADKAGPTQIMQGRIIAVQGVSTCSTMLREPDLEDEPVDLASRTVWVWAVPEPEPLAATEAVLDAFADLTEMRAGIADEWTDHVARWSEPMAAKLRANAHKSGWLHDAPKVLLDRVNDELEELSEALAKVIESARAGALSGYQVASLRADAADVANMAMMVADAVEHQGAALKRWRVPEVRRSEPVRIAIGPYLIHEQRGPDGVSGLTIRKSNEVGSEPVFEIEASGTGNWRHTAYPATAEHGRAEINVNAIVEFSLTARGATAWNRLHSDAVAVGQSIKAQLWKVMQALGSSTEMGFNPPIKGNVIRVDLGSDCVSLTGDPPFASGKINGSPVAAKPSHRAATLTAETLGLARRVATYLIEWTHRTAPDPIDQDTATAKRLLVELAHAEGMPAADLRKLCKWARETTKACADLGSDWLVDPSIVEIVDRVLLHLAIDEMPVGSIDVRGSEPIDARDAAVFERHVAKAAKNLRDDLRGSTVEVVGGTHLRALGFVVDTASLRRLARGQGSLREDLVVPMLDEVDRLRAELRLAKPVELRTKLVRTLGLPDGTSISEVADVVERLVERVEEQAYTLKSIADEFAGAVDPTNPLPEVRALVRRHDRYVAQLGELADECCPAASVDILAAVRGMKRDITEISRAFAEVGDQIGNPSNVWVALRELIRKNRLLDVTLGPLFGISKHGQSLSAEELIDGAKAKLFEVESLDRLGDWLRESMGEHFAIEGIAESAIRRLREGDKLLVSVRADLRHREDELEAMEADDWRECKAQALPLTTALKRIDAILRGSDPADVSEATVIMSAEAAEELAVRVAVLQQQLRAKVIDFSARSLAQSLSDALRKIDRISHGVDPAEAMAPVITAAMADELVTRIGQQLDAFRRLGQRTMAAVGELAACEALIHRGFDRLREVDPEFVESLRKGGS